MERREAISARWPGMPQRGEVNSSQRVLFVRAARTKVILSFIVSAYGLGGFGALSFAHVERLTGLENDNITPVHKQCQWISGRRRFCTNE
jgi:hypothetical protein